MNRGSTLRNSPKIAPYGSWKSPITSDLIVEGSVGLSQPSFDGDDIYWMEMRPKEAGRNVIVKRNAAGLLSRCESSHPSMRAQEFMNTAVAIIQSSKELFVFQTSPIKGSTGRMDRRNASGTNRCRRHALRR